MDRFEDCCNINSINFFKISQIKKTQNDGNKYPSRSFPSPKTPKSLTLFSVQESLSTHTHCPLVLLLNYEVPNQESYETIKTF